MAETETFEIEIIGFPNLDDDEAATEIVEAFAEPLSLARTYVGCIPVIFRSRLTPANVEFYARTLLRIGADIKVYAQPSNETWVCRTTTGPLPEPDDIEAALDAIEVDLQKTLKGKARAEGDFEIGLERLRPKVVLKPGMPPTIEGFIGESEQAAEPVEEESATLRLLLGKLSEPGEEEAVDLHFPTLKKFDVRAMRRELRRQKLMATGLSWAEARRQEFLGKDKFREGRRRIVLATLAATLLVYYLFGILGRSPEILLETESGVLSAELPLSHNDIVQRGNVREMSFGRVLYSSFAAQNEGAVVKLFSLTHFTLVSGGYRGSNETRNLLPAAAAVVENLGATITSSDEIQYEIARGFEFEFSGTNSGLPVFGRGRIYCAHNEYVVLLFAGYDESVLTNSDGLSFFDSFSYSSWG